MVVQTPSIFEFKLFPETNGCIYIDKVVAMLGANLDVLKLLIDSNFMGVLISAE